MTTWSAGRYELTAQRLQPAADELVRELGAIAGVRLLDVGCGTGNAALAAARAGARATGIDPATRLLEIGRARAQDEGVAVELREGDATALPFEDDAFDVAVSVFGVIFAEPEQAAAELLRVVRPGGRVALTTWLPGGVAGRFADVIREAFGQPPAPARWSDPAFVEALFAPHPVAHTEHTIAFTAPSPEEYAAEGEEHPMWLAACDGLAAAGKLDEVRERLREVLAEGNEDPAAFRTTSRYAIATVTVRAR